MTKLHVKPMHRTCKVLISIGKLPKQLVGLEPMISTSILLLQVEEMQFELEHIV